MIGTRAGQMGLVGASPGAAFPRPDTTVSDLFAAQVARAPQAAALITGARCLTFAELDARVTRLARSLAAAGIRPETAVPVLADRSPEYVVAILGVLRAGAAYVPMDPRSPPARLRFIVSDTHASLVLARRRFADALAGADTMIGDLDDDAPPAAAAVAALPEGVSRRLACIIYTSGSTGTPKGVLVEHRAIVNRLAWLWDRFPFADDDVCCLQASVAFVDAVGEVFGPLLAGRPLVLLDEDDLVDHRRLIDRLNAHGVTRFAAVPSFIKSFLETCGQPARALPRLRHWQISGERLSRDLGVAFAQSLEGATVLDRYGSTEATSVLYEELSAETLTATRAALHVIFDTRLYVLDDDLDPVGPGTIGELYVAGAPLARGYLGRPASTADRFLPDPFALTPGGRMYRTGDLARLTAEGGLELVGRRDSQVKIRGFRVEPAEVEAALTSVPAVRHAAVIARADDDGTEPKLIAFVTPTATARAWPEARLQHHLRMMLTQLLPDYMRPSRYVLIETMPVTDSGKIDRTALRDLPADRPPAEDQPASPVSPFELRVTQVWQDVVGTLPHGDTDDFFTLGGDSLLANRLAARLRNALGVAVSVRDVFDTPRLSDLVGLMRHRTGGDGSGPRSSETTAVATGT